MEDAASCIIFFIHEQLCIRATWLEISENRYSDAGMLHVEDTLEVKDRQSSSAFSKSGILHVDIIPKVENRERSSVISDLKEEWLTAGSPSLRPGLSHQNR